MQPLVALGVASLYLSLSMAFAWYVQRLTGNAGWADAFWSISVGFAGATLALVPVAGAAEWPTERQVLVCVLVALWGLRLGLHIAERCSRGAEDPRYAQFRKEWGEEFQPRLLHFLQIQALAGIVLAMTVLLAAQNPASGLRLQDWVAVLVLAVAIVGEGIADRQLRAFKAKQKHNDGVCDTGLWAWSRHPNYFFEWVGWCAWPLFAIDLSFTWPWGLLALAGPVMMYWLLVHVSGIPPLEAHMLRSRQAAFADYQRRVPAFFPRLLG